MLKFVLICGFFQIVSLTFCQSRNDCDEIATFFRQKTYTSEQSRKFAKWKEVRKMRKCISNHLIDVNSFDNFTLRLSNLSHEVETKRERNKILMYIIKTHPYFNDEFKAGSSQSFVSSLTASDKKIAKKRNLKMIRRNFGLESYLKVLVLFSKSIHGKQKKEIENLFKNKDSLSLVPKSTIWQSALLLSTQNDTTAENYVLKKINEGMQVFGRMGINKFANDLAATRNRRLMDYIIDDFLMSDYKFWDIDYGHSDFGAAENILIQAVDSPVFDDSIKFADDEVKRIAYIRQWFRDNRNTYKMKP